MNKIIQAAKLAKLCHQKEVRKFSGRPYITHPMRVSARLSILDDTSEDLVCAAWLHDIYDGCNRVPTNIVNDYGPRVDTYIWEVTNPKKEKQFPITRNEEFDGKYFRLSTTLAKRLKIAERIDNLCEMGLAKNPEDIVGIDWCTAYIIESKLIHDRIGDCCEELAKELLFYIRNVGRRFGLEL